VTGEISRRKLGSLDTKSHSHVCILQHCYSCNQGMSRGRSVKVNISEWKCNLIQCRLHCYVGGFGKSTVLFSMSFCERAGYLSGMLPSCMWSSWSGWALTWGLEGLCRSSLF
jgi:hypothetical protein